MRRGLPPDDRGRLQAALLRGPRRAGPARHRDRRRAGEPRRRRALPPPRRRLLPAAGRTHPGGAHRAGRLSQRPRGPLLVLAAPAPRAPQPGAGAAGAPGGGRRAAPHGPAGGRTEPGRDGPSQAPGGHRRSQDGAVRVLRDQPRRDAGAARRPVRPAARGGRVVSHRPLPPARRLALFPAVAHPLAGHVRHTRSPRLRPARRLRSRRLP